MLLFFLSGALFFSEGLPFSLIFAHVCRYFALNIDLILLVSVNSKLVFSRASEILHSFR